MNDTVIEIRGGVLVGIYRKGNNNPVIVVDWDKAPYGSPVSFEQSLCMAKIPKDTQKVINTMNVSNKN